MNDTFADFTQLATRATPPVLILSTAVGRGMMSIGEALAERFAPGVHVHHRTIEEFLPPAALAEDVVRYRLISTHAPVLLNLVYRVPFFYWRKYVRERLRRGHGLDRLRDEIDRAGVRTIICVSHRAAFWVSKFKRATAADFELWDVLAEYGHNWGYKYLFWDAIDAFLSPVERERLRFAVPPRTGWWPLKLPARRAFTTLAAAPGDREHVLLMAGQWGQGELERPLQVLLRQSNRLHVHVVCGANHRLLTRLTSRHAGERVHVLGALDSIAPVLRACGAVVTKPGISTILETHAARRKLFLIRGMPVAEDNNARYAIAHFGAEWFDGAVFQRWYEQP